MITKEDLKELENIHKDFKDMLRTKYPNAEIRWLLMTGKEDVNLNAGNSCCVCMAQMLVEFIRDNNIDHDGSEEETVN